MDVVQKLDQISFVFTRIGLEWIQTDPKVDLPFCRSNRTDVSVCIKEVSGLQR